MQKRVKFDFEIFFTNGGNIKGEDFRLDIEGDDISDEELAAYIVKDMRLLMVGQTKIINKKVFEEPHKRKFLNPEDFIKKYESALKTQDWNNVDPLFHSDACVTFSNGAIHLGKLAIKAAFEKNFKTIKSEAYSIENVRWVLKNESTAVYVFDFFWKGIIGGELSNGEGIGTTILVNVNGNWVLLAEHLGKKAPTRAD